MARSRPGEGSSAVVLASVAISVRYGEHLGLRAALCDPCRACPVRPAWLAARLREFVAMLHRCFLGRAARCHVWGDYTELMFTMQIEDANMCS